MDEIEQRLRQSVDQCFKSYEAWRKNEHDENVRETLQNAVHELRKVASRVEIELAISERKDMAQRPIPIPPHRDARGRQQSAPASVDEGNDIEQTREPRNFRSNNNGNNGGSNGEPPRRREGLSMRRSGGPVDPSSGGSQGNS